MSFNKTTLRSYSFCSCPWPLRACNVCPSHTHTLCIYQLKKGGGDNHWARDFCPSIPAAVTWGGDIHTHTHTHRNAHTGLLAGTHSVRWVWRLGVSQGRQAEWGREKGRAQRQESPHLPLPSRAPILKASLSLHGRKRWGAWRLNLQRAVVLLVNTGSSTLVIHDNQKERLGRQKVREKNNTEKLSCGQRALSWSGVWRTKQPVIFIFSPLYLLNIVHRHVPLLFTENKQASKRHRQRHVQKHVAIWIMFIQSVQ